MALKARTRPSKAISLMSLLLGLGMVGFGVFFYFFTGLWPVLIWTLFISIIAAAHAFNLFSEKGLTHEITEIEGASLNLNTTSSSDSIKARLRKLDRLKWRGVITAEEHREQRKRILDDI